MAIQKETVTFKIKGTSPLLCHNPAGSLKRGGEAKKGKEIPTPEVEAEVACYRNDGGDFMFPSIGMRSAILSASRSFKKGRSSAFYAVSHIEMKDEFVTITNGNGKKATSYEIDTRRAVVMKSGVLRSRPKFVNWGCQFSIIYDPALVSEKEILTYAEEAGQKIGIGDYRPQRGGWFGRFEIV